MRSSRSFAVAFAFFVLCLSAGGWIVTPALAETAEEEEKERRERTAPAGGSREGLIADHPVEILVNGVKKGQFTGTDLQKLPSTAAFSPRGKRTSWTVMEVLNAYQIPPGATINFYNEKDKKMSLPWEELVRQKDKVNFSYNFKGELILSTDVADKVPEEVRSTDHRDAGTEDQRREEMHKQRKRSLIFFRDVRRVEVVQ